jgi:hypothetical protein
MNTLRNITVSLVLILSLLSVSSTPAFSSSAKAKGSISKADLKVLLKTAQTPAEHRKIAEYYRQEAAKLAAVAKEHRDLALVYEQRPPNPALEAKHGSAVEGASHCRRWAELTEQEAKEAESLAELHEGMAKMAEQK